jgi:hypothetical protein
MFEPRPSTRARHGLAPAFHGFVPKSHYTDVAEKLALKEAFLAAQYTDLPLPVIFNNQQIGWTLGFQHCADVMYLPQRRSLDKIIAAGFPTYDSIINAISVSGTRYSAPWSKGATTAGVALNWYDLWPVGGNPPQGLYTGTASNSVQQFDTTVGSISTMGNVTPKTKHILSVWGMFTAGATPPTLVLYDRCVHYVAVPYNNNALNTLTQTNTPTSTRYSTNSDSGCKIIITMQTVGSATQQSFTTLGYTNQAGTASQVAPCSTTTTNIIVSVAAPTATLGARVASPCATAAGTQVTSPYMPLAVGDVGVQLIKNFTNNAVAINTGTMCFVMGRPLAILPLSTLGVTSLVDTVMMTAALERIFDGACLSFLTYFPVATGATITGGVDVGWN